MRIALIISVILLSITAAFSQMIDNGEDIENVVNIDGKQWSYSLTYMGGRLSTETGKKYKIELSRNGKPKYWGEFDVLYFDILNRVNFNFIYKDGKDKGNQLKNEPLTFKYMAEQERLECEPIGFRTGSKSLDDAVYKSIEELIKLL